MESNNYSKVINLKDSLNIQEDSIVSRVLLKNGDESITLFAFSKDQHISAHTAPVDAMVQVIEGELEIIIDQDKFDLKQNDSMIMPANVPHALTAKTDMKMLLVKM